jgi:thiosulfate/3-mercaptopyruvate sulfurtransferase
VPFDTILSTQTLADHIGDPDWVIFDCRFELSDSGAGERSYCEGHLPGARYVHLDRDLSSPVTPTSGRHPLPAPEILASKLGEWGVDCATQVVVYDDAGGAIAARMWWLLRWLGHNAVALLDGGIGQWTRERRPLSQEAPRAASKRFSGRVAADQWMTAEQVQAALARNNLLLMDARAGARFCGKEEPIDPVAGHVPGAVNRPYQLNLTENGLFLPADELRRQFSERLGNWRPEQTAHMCGSGVTACHNLLAMELAQFPGSRLYPGSWSEWIRDPGRSIETES